MGKAQVAATVFKPIGRDIFSQIFIIPTLNLLVLFLAIFNAAHIPGAFGFAIISLVVFVRAILHPFFVQQIQTQRKMQELKPQLDALSARYKKDPKKLQQEQMRMYKEAGLNPASGCLTMIIQLPVFIGLYSTLSLILKGGATAKTVTEINKILYIPAIKIHSLDPRFFGLNLALTPQSSHLWYYYLVPVVTGLLQFAQAKYGTPGMSPTPVADTPKKEDKKLAKKGEEEEKPNNSGDFQKALNMQMKYFFPFMIAYFSFSLPVGLSLYWNIFSIFSILQYRRVNSKV